MPLLPRSLLLLLVGALFAVLTAQANLQRAVGPDQRIPPDLFPNLPFCKGHGPPQPDPPAPPKQPPGPSPSPPPQKPDLPGPPPQPPPGPDPCQCYYFDFNAQTPKPCPTASVACKLPTPEKKAQVCDFSAPASATIQSCDDSCTLKPYTLTFSRGGCQGTPPNCPNRQITIPEVGSDTSCTKCKFYSKVDGGWVKGCDTTVEWISVTGTLVCGVKERVIQPAFPGQDGINPADATSCFTRHDVPQPPITCSPGTCNWNTLKAADNCAIGQTYQAKCVDTSLPGGPGGIPQVPPIPMSPPPTPPSTGPGGNVTIVSAHAIWLGEPVTIFVGGTATNGIACSLSLLVEGGPSGYTVAANNLWTSNPSQSSFGATVTHTPQQSGHNYYVLTCANTTFGYDAVWVENHGFKADISVALTGTLGSPISVTATTQNAAGKQCSLYAVFPDAIGYLMQPMATWTGNSVQTASFTPAGIAGTYAFNLQCDGQVADSASVTVVPDEEEEGQDR